MRSPTWAPTRSSVDTMRKAAVILAIAAILGASLAYAASRGPVLPTEACDLHFSNGVTLPGVPVARTPAAQDMGLSHRFDVGPGMLFSWDQAAHRAFWMRNTYVPLSIGFINADGVLFGIRDMQPETETLHHSGEPATDALELIRGEFKRLGLKGGMRLVKRECGRERR